MLFLHMPLKILYLRLIKNSCKNGNFIYFMIANLSNPNKAILENFFLDINTSKSIDKQIPILANYVFEKEDFQLVCNLLIPLK